MAIKDIINGGFGFAVNQIPVRGFLFASPDAGIATYPGETIAHRSGPGMTRAEREGPGETSARRSGPGITRVRRKP